MIRFLLIFSFFLLPILTKEIKDPVVKYDKEEFRKLVPLKHHVVLFFTKWSSASKDLIPIWDALGEKFNGKKEKDSEIVIAKVDCSAEWQICEWQDIVDYPTIKLYKHAGDIPEGTDPSTKMRIFKYTGVIDLQSLEQFVNGHMVRGAEFIYGARVSKIPEPDEGLHTLQEENFEESIQEVKNSFVNFCTDWSSRCQKLKKIWQDIAREFRYEDFFMIGTVDCTKQKSLCRENGVSRFPELLWFKDNGDYDETFPDREVEPTFENLNAFVLRKLGKKELEKKDFPLFEEEDMEMMRSEALVLDKKNFNQEIESGKLFLVYSHAPWCSLCPKYDPHWENIAEMFNKKPTTLVEGEEEEDPNLKTRNNDEDAVSNPKGLIIAKLDCTLNKVICDQQNIYDLPSFTVFRNGAIDSAFEGELTPNNLYKFAYKLSGTEERWDVNIDDLPSELVEDKNEL